MTAASLATSQTCHSFERKPWHFPVICSSQNHPKQARVCSWLSAMSASFTGLCVHGQHHRSTKQSQEISLFYIDFSSEAMTASSSPHCVCSHRWLVWCWLAFPFNCWFCMNYSFFRSADVWCTSSVCFLFQSFLLVFLFQVWFLVILYRVSCCYMLRNSWRQEVAWNFFHFSFHCYTKWIKVR